MKQIPVILVLALLIVFSSPHMGTAAQCSGCGPGAQVFSNGVWSPAAAGQCPCSGSGAGDNVDLEWLENNYDYWDKFMTDLTENWFQYYFKYYFIHFLSIF